jgi:hypothetical protein
LWQRAGLRSRLRLALDARRGGRVDARLRRCARLLPRLRDGLAFGARLRRLGTSTRRIRARLRDRAGLRPRLRNLLALHAGLRRLDASRSGRLHRHPARLGPLDLPVRLRGGLPALDGRRQRRPGRCRRLGSSAIARIRFAGNDAVRSLVAPLARNGLGGR